MNRSIWRFVQLFGISCGLAASLIFVQGDIPADAQTRQTSASRLAQLVEANVIAVHAYQVLLAKKSSKGDQACYVPGRLSDSELEVLVQHQAGLLTSDLGDVKAWVLGKKSNFDPARHLEPILSAGVVLPGRTPVNVFTEYLRKKTNTGGARIRAIANLYQTVLEVERDGDRLQEEFAFYIALGLPVYVGQLNLPGTDEAMLGVGQQLAAQTCASPFETDAAAWQIAGRKIWNWGEKNLHIRDEKVVASELLRESEVKAELPRLRQLAAQRIAVIGHSFTMGLHWSSPSSFVPIVIDIFRRENPKVEFKQFAAGGLTASRAKQRFYQSVLDWKPDKVLLVVMTRTDEDYDALKQIGEGFGALGIKTSMFDEVHDPASVKPDTVERAVKVARAGDRDHRGRQRIIVSARSGKVRLPRRHTHDRTLSSIDGERVAQVSYPRPRLTGIDWSEQLIRIELQGLF